MRLAPSVTEHVPFSRLSANTRSLRALRPATLDTCNPVAMDAATRRVKLSLRTQDAMPALQTPGSLLCAARRSLALFA